MGRNRSKPGNNRPRFKGIPMCWLAAPIPNKAIRVPSKDNVKFIICKTPLPTSFTSLLSSKENWCVAKAVEKAKSLVHGCVKVVAINVSSCNEVISEADWGEYGVQTFRIDMKEYERSHIDTFCDYIDDLVFDGPTAIIVYCGKGTNRAPYLVSGYLARNGMSVVDAVDDCLDAYENCLFKKEPRDSLERIFDETIDIKLKDPHWYKFAEPVSVGDVPRDLTQRSRSLEKVSKKQGTNKFPLPAGEEYDHIMELLRSVTNHWEYGADIPVFKTHMYNPESIDEVKENRHYCTFEPRGFRGFIIATSKDDVYYVDEYNDIWKLKATTEAKVPAVAAAVFSIENRNMMFMTDCLLYGDERVCDMRLSLRLSYCYKFSTNIKGLDTDDRELLFLYRPVSELHNITLLQKDLSKLACKCDGITICREEWPTGSSWLIPLRPTVQLQVNLNTYKKAILFARSGPGDEDLAPVGVMTLTEEGLEGLDLRTSRIKYNPNKKERWQAMDIGMNDPPDRADYVTDMVNFMDRYAFDESKDQDVKQILRDLEKIRYD